MNMFDFNFWADVVLRKPRRTIDQGRTDNHGRIGVLGAAEGDRLVITYNSGWLRFMSDDSLTIGAPSIPYIQQILCRLDNVSTVSILCAGITPKTAPMVSVQCIKRVAALLLSARTQSGTKRKVCAMNKSIISKEVAAQFAAALELFLNWIDQRREIQKSSPKEEKPLRILDEINLLNAVEVSKLLGVSESYAYRLM